MNYAVILLAGSGTRFGGNVPKQFVDVDGHPLCFYAINCFERSPQIDEIILVTQKEYSFALSGIVQNCGFKKVKSIVLGGKTRQESSKNALEYLHTIAKDDDIVLIHDGARPLVDEDIIDANIKCAKEFGACLTAIISNDTIVMSENGDNIESVPPRKFAFLAQTPQTFTLQTIYNAHAQAPKNESFTDDSQVVLKSGHVVKIVLGNNKLHKVTTFDDLALIKTYIRRGNYQ